MSVAEECRLHAAECLRAAQMALVPDVKATLVSMAQHWNELAERMERFAERMEHLQANGGGKPGHDTHP